MAIQDVIGSIFPLPCILQMVTGSQKMFAAYPFAKYLPTIFDSGINIYTIITIQVIGRI